MFLLVLSAQLIVVTPVAGGAAGRANAGLAACITARVETQHHSPEHGKSPPPQCCAVASAPADKSLCRDRASPPQLLTNNRKPQRISILARRRRDQ